MGKSTDQPGSAAVIVYIDPAISPAVPEAAGGLRTVVVPASARSVALGSAPLTASTETNPLQVAAIARAVAIKRKLARTLMQQHPGFFGIGVGQSLDDSRQPALVVYVDRNRMPAELPATLGGLRTQYVIMNRLHVTRSYAAASPQEHHCVPHEAGRGRQSDGLWNPPGVELP